MGNPKFRLSHMLPNAWFYKLLDHHGRHRYRHPRPPLPAGKTATKGAGLEITPNNSSNRLQHESYKGSQQRSLGAAEHSESGRKSYYFTRELNAAATTATTGDPPRKSTKKRHPHRRPTGNHHVSSISAVCTCRATASLHPCRPKPDSPPPELSSSTTGDCSAVDGSSLLLPTESFDRMLSLSTGDGGDIVIDVDKKSLAGKIETQMGLPPIITKPEKTTTQMEEKIKPKENSNGSDFSTTLMKKIDNNSQEQSIRRVKKSPGLKLRVNSPRIVSASGGRRSVSGGGGRRSGASESCLAVVKASYDPQKDFRESMVEMIVKNNIRGSKDLEDLLASYLLLNSDEYHDMIIKVFKQIWFDLSELKQSKLMDKI